MKLIIFDKNNIDSGVCRSGVRSISINRKNGNVVFSQLIREDFKLNVGMKISFAQDEDSMNDWYVSFSENGNGFTIREAQLSGKMKKLYLTNKIIANKLADTVKAENSAALLIGSKPVKIGGVEWYKIVTSKPLRKN